MSEHCRRTSAVLAFAFATLLKAQTPTFSDDFNRPDGAVGNGWSVFGAGASIVGGRLQTIGAVAVGGGIYRTLSETLPVTFSFDFSTAEPSNGGWFIALNAVSTLIPGPPAGQISFQQYAGSRNIIRRTPSDFESFPNLPEPIPGWENYGSSAAHIQGIVNADLSSVITIKYADGVQVTATFGPTAPGPVGSLFVLGNSDAAAGPHFFDNLTLSAGPVYSVCLLYDPSKAIKSGSTIPIKLQLCSSGGENQSSSSVVLHAISITQASSTISGQVEDSGNANPDNDFRYDPTLGGTGGYIFNLSTKGLATGTYNLNFKAGADPTIYQAPFQVK